MMIATFPLPAPMCCADSLVSPSCQQGACHEDQVIHVLLLLILRHAHCMPSKSPGAELHEVMGSISVQLLAGHGIGDLNLKVCMELLFLAAG